MKIIAIAGGIAVGKSTACKFLKASGAEVIYLDEISRKVRRTNRDAQIVIAQIFGPEVRMDTESLEIDDSKLRIMAFACPDKLKQLEQALSPFIYYELEEQMFDVLNSPASLCVIEGHDFPRHSYVRKIVDELWVIVCDEKERLKRLMERDGYDKDYALLRIQAQRPQNDVAAEADRVIDSTEHGNLEKQIKHSIIQYLA